MSDKPRPTMPDHTKPNQAKSRHIIPRTVLLYMPSLNEKTVFQQCRDAWWFKAESPLPGNFRVTGSSRPKNYGLSVTRR